MRTRSAPTPNLAQTNQLRENRCPAAPLGLTRGLQAIALHRAMLTGGMSPVAITAELDDLHVKAEVLDGPAGGMPGIAVRRLPGNGVVYNR